MINFQEIFLLFRQKIRWQASFLVNSALLNLFCWLLTTIWTTLRIEQFTEATSLYFSFHLLWSDSYFLHKTKNALCKIAINFSELWFIFCLGQPKSIKKLPGSKHSELKKIQEFSRTPPKIQGLFKTMWTLACYTIKGRELS